MARSIQLPPALLPELMAEAVESQAIGVLENAPERHRFVHSLVREVIYDELLPARRVALHALAGKALESSAVGGPDVDPAALAHHYSAAAPPGAPEGRQVLRPSGASRCLTPRLGGGLRSMGAEPGAARTPSGRLDRALPSRIGSLCEDLGDAYGLVGDSDRANDAYERAARLLPPRAASVWPGSSASRWITSTARVSMVRRCWPSERQTPFWGRPAEPKVLSGGENA